MKFNVGDRVRVLHSDCGVYDVGTVIKTMISYASEEVCAVKHDNFDSRLHECNGICENGYGWYYRLNEIEPLNAVTKSKRKSFKCCRCHDSFSLDEVEKTANGKYICYHCKEVQSYYTKNDAKTHTGKGHNKTYGFELECVPNCHEDALVLYDRKYNLKATSDASLPDNGIEFKTPTYYSLNGIKRMLTTFSRYVDFGHESCGQHINIGDTEYLNADTICKIKEHAYDIFRPLYEAMYDNPLTTKKICGRYFNDYAQWDSSFESHFSWINLNHDNRIEFRISKIRTPEQYVQLTYMWTEVVDAIITHFIKNGCTHKAAGKTSKYLVRIWEKYVAGKATCQRPERNSKIA